MLIGAVRRLDEKFLIDLALRHRQLRLVFEENKRVLQIFLAHLEDLVTDRKAESAVVPFNELCVRLDGKVALDHIGRNIRVFQIRRDIKHSLALLLSVAPSRNVINGADVVLQSAIVVHKRDLVLNLIVYRVKSLRLHPDSGVELQGEDLSGLILVLLQDVA